jgi:uncharacterized membrane-anchored protein YhcB (DUF1043 family)
MEIAPATWDLLKVGACALVVGFILGAVAMEFARRFLDSVRNRHAAEAYKKARLFLTL